MAMKKEGDGDHQIAPGQITHILIGGYDEKKPTRVEAKGGGTHEQDEQGKHRTSMGYK